MFGADKTKVTITGSKHDMSYYQDINIWSLYGDKLTVAENNDHLGLVVSGIDEEVKNVDKNISSARDTLFSFWEIYSPISARYLQLYNITHGLFTSNLSSGLGWLLYPYGHQLSRPSAPSITKYSVPFSS